MKKILMLIRTPSLKNDDRVRKESVSISKKYDTRIVSFENSNLDLSDYYKGVTVKRKNISLRKIFGSGKFLPLKIIEMYIKFIIEYLKFKPNIIWLHNFEMIGLVYVLGLFKRLGLFKAKIIWDEHELPPNLFLRNKILKNIYSTTLKSCDLNFIADKARGEYVNNCLSQDVEYISINNYPDRTFLLEKALPLPIELEEWLGRDDFFLCQSGARQDRALIEVVSAAVIAKKKVVFVGPYNEIEIDEIIAKDSRVLSFAFFVKSVPQMRLVDFIDRSLASIIFYKKTSMNNWLCAPNRLYLSIARKKPVISGNNPVFVSSSIDNEISICDTDGSDRNLIANALRDFVRSDDEKFNEKLIWKNVEDEMKSAISHVV